jgi:hypothetical protein
MHDHSLAVHQLLILFHRHRTRHFGIHTMQIRLHPAPLHLALTSILLAQVSVTAARVPTLALLRAWHALQYVLQHVSGLWLQLPVVKGTSESGTDAVEVVAVTRLLLVEARVVDGPFFCGWGLYVGVEALGVLV